MEYEILDMNEKIIAGLCARTNNSAPDMPQVIGGLWTRLYGEGLHLSMPNKANDKSCLLYTSFSSGPPGTCGDIAWTGRITACSSYTA